MSRAVSTTPVSSQPTRNSPGVELGTDLLELGPGPGAATEWLRHRVARLVAVEQEEEAAARLARMVGFRGDLAAPAGSLPFGDLRTVELARALVAAAQRVVVIADSTKWGTVGIASIAALPRADVLITDSRLPEETRTRLAELVGELIVVEVEA